MRQTVPAVFEKEELMFYYIGSVAPVQGVPDMKK